MIFHRLRDKEGDLGIQECDEGLTAITIVIKAEGRIASAFYLVPPPSPLSSPRRLPSARLLEEGLRAGKPAGERGRVRGD